MGSPACKPTSDGVCANAFSSAASVSVVQVHPSLSLIPKYAIKN